MYGGEFFCREGHEGSVPEKTTSGNRLASPRARGAATTARRVAMAGAKSPRGENVAENTPLVRLPRPALFPPAFVLLDLAFVVGNTRSADAPNARPQRPRRDADRRPRPDRVALDLLAAPTAHRGASPASLSPSVPGGISAWYVMSHSPSGCAGSSGSARGHEQKLLSHAPGAPTSSNGLASAARSHRTPSRDVAAPGRILKPWMGPGPMPRLTSSALPPR